MNPPNSSTNHQPKQDPPDGLSAEERATWDELSAEERAAFPPDCRLEVVRRALANRRGQSEPNADEPVPQTAKPKPPPARREETAEERQRKAEATRRAQRVREEGLIDVQGEAADARPLGSRSRQPTKPTPVEQTPEPEPKPDPEPPDYLEALAAAGSYSHLWSDPELLDGLDLSQPLRAELLDQVRPRLERLVEVAPGLSFPDYPLPDGGLWRVFTAPRETEIRLEYQFDPNLGRRGGLHYGCSALELHQVWEALPAQQQPPHPLAPLVEAWQARPTPTNPFCPVRRGNLPRLQKATDEDRYLLEARQPLPSPAGSQMMLDLPELTPTGRTSWLLDLFDRAGGQIMRQGRGAPWDMRLFVGAVLYLSIDDRDGQWHSFRIPTAEVIGWLHPDGWKNRARDWDKFPQALFRMNKELGFVGIEGLGYVQIIGATVIPQTPDDPYVEFILRIPKTAANGARIDWPTLCKYGQHSAVLYRAYLTACDFMHLSAYQGQPITAEIGKPLSKPDGEPQRRKGGKVKRSTIERIANPSTRYVKGLTTGELTEMIGMDANDKRRRHDAINAFKRLDADGVIDLKQDGKRWRIYGPQPGDSS